MLYSRCRRPNALPDFRFIDLLDSEESFGEAFLAGMTARDKSLPCRFLYDAEGSALFDRICALEEYYPTRTEIGILIDNASALADLIGPLAALVELGSGSSVKTHILLRRMKSPAAYMPVDVSREHLRAAAEGIACEYPGVAVTAICADYAERFALPDCEGRRVAFFPGSTIGNLTRGEAISLLEAWRERLGRDGLLIVGVDLKKDPSRLEAAYNDAEGVTEAFIKNILARANRELGGDFDLDAFDYDARWNAEAGRIEMRVESRRRQKARAAGADIALEKGETIHIENSHKYGLEEFTALARAAGFSSRARFVDAARLFSVHVLAAD
jgi:dimethylhistidine N-methyltransferase